MKNYFIYPFILSLLLLTGIQKGTCQNLVRNPSFEDTINCPAALNQLYTTSDWFNYGISPDYYNACSTTGVNVPNAIFGFQNAHTGTGMIGMFLKRKPNSPDGINAKEFIGTELISNLNIGFKYYFSCFINFSYRSLDAVACNKFGMKLSTVPFDSTQYLNLVNNFAILYTDSIVIDSVQWFKLNGSFIADSNYQYLILGNFFEDQFIDTISIGQFPDYSYYYIDDICLSQDSNYCETWTSFQPENNIDIDYIEIFPVPSLDHVTITSKYSIKAIEIYDVYGSLQYSKMGQNGLKLDLDISFFSMGIYFIRIQTNGSTIFKTIIKQ